MQTNIHRIAVIDDHAIVRQGLRMMIESQENMELVAESDGQDDVIALCLESKPTLLMLDITLSDTNGIELIKHLKKEIPKLPILIFSMHDENLYAVHAIKAGASGYLHKNQSFDKYLEAIQTVLSGKKYLSSTMVQLLADRIHSGDDENLQDKLSFREFQTLKMLSSGLTVSDIAEKLFLSVKTISMYRSRILQKLKLKNNSELISFAIKNKLLD
jgi:two-component system, NarL family, invasion response regulator UvrY